MKLERLADSGYELCCQQYCVFGKYMWLMFYLSFNIYNICYVLIFYQGCMPGNSCWHTSSGLYTTVGETML